MSGRDGGPAFPHPSDQFAGGTTHWAETGMTLRDYFMAHAPAEPQRWFQPTMPVERPALRFFIEDPEGGPPVEFATFDAAVTAARGDEDEVDSNQHKREAWDAEYSKRRYIQWPAAWADEMLQQRGA